jgi:hypothetical protein
LRSSHFKKQIKMNTIDLKQVDANLSELTFTEQQEVAGGSFLSYAVGYILGSTIGIGLVVIASATLAVLVVANTSGPLQGGGEQS